jgi:hypothetical protein
MSFSLPELYQGEQQLAALSLHAPKPPKINLPNAYTIGVCGGLVATQKQ